MKVFPSESLAWQRTLEDEEEQERERRRRHRNLSSATEDEAPRLSQHGDRRTSASERLPSTEEAEVPKPPPPASKDEDKDIHTILRTRQERRQRQQAVEAAQAPIRERLEAEKGRDSLSPGQATQQPLVPRKEPMTPPRRRLSREQQGPWALEEESLTGREPGGRKKGVPEKSPVLEESSTPEKTAPKKSLVSEKTSISKKGLASEKTSLLEKTAVSENKSDLGKNSVSDKSLGSGRRLVSEKASIFEKTLASEKSPTTDAKLAPKRATASEQLLAQEPPASGGSPATTKEQRERTLPRKNLPSLAEQGASDPPTVASRLPPITLQVGSVPSLPPFHPATWLARLASPTQAGLGCLFSPCLLPAMVRARTLRWGKLLELKGSPAVGQGAPGAPYHILLQGLDYRTPADSWEASDPSRSSPRKLCLVPWPQGTVKIPSKEEETYMSSPTQRTYSSSLKRSSSRTISFRMNPRKDDSETTLTRSASMRLPANTVKLGEKLERYHTAIQRSESIKSLGSSRTEFFVAPVSVASKRHLFEKERAGQSQAEPASSRQVLFVGEFEALRDCDIKAQPVDQQDPGVRRSGRPAPRCIVLTALCPTGVTSSAKTDLHIFVLRGLPHARPLPLTVAPLPPLIAPVPFLPLDLFGQSFWGQAYPLSPQTPSSPRPHAPNIMAPVSLENDELSESRTNQARNISMPRVEGQGWGRAEERVSPAWSLGMSKDLWLCPDLRFDPEPFLSPSLKQMTSEDFHMLMP
ncbi:L-arabinitol 4-dehydrogenase [Saguinus oedipus]|uniref:L-arabinitol 4-dehydrogenase n=1 Tax=Saguinus oedipus TaxID=9490 RepID=A0ABQ9TNA2_SAGOE|nr:L-arabinitol 4-dehydrogenase [Saguinus oedipus]